MKNRDKIKSITYISLGAVVLAICSWISLFGFTLQTFGVYFLLFFMGGKKALASVAVYLLLGAAGVPVFAGFGGGIAWLLGPTGGFLFGFLAACGIYIASESIFGKSSDRWYIRALASFLGLAACYLLGASVMLLHGGNINGESRDIFALLLGYIQLYAIFDIIKILFADFVSRYIKRIKAISV